MIKIIIAGTLLSSLTLFALPNNELELVILSKVIEKKAVVLSNMGLSGETKSNFGKLYDEYQTKLMKHRVTELKLIENYATNYNNLTNDKANELLKTWVTAEDSAAVLKKDYIAKFKKVMPAADVIRYFQIENRLQLRSEVAKASLIPLAQPAETK